MVGATPHGGSASTGQTGTPATPIASARRTDRLRRRSQRQGPLEASHLSDLDIFFVHNVMAAMLKMRKIEIEELERAGAA
jgi:hypothetical protein